MSGNQMNRRMTVEFSLVNQSKYAFRFVAILCVVTLLFVSSAVVTPAYAQEESVHVVQSGESLSSIAARYGVNMYALARYNGIANVNIVRPGQVLRIPTVTISVAPAQPTATSIVVEMVARPKNTEPAEQPRSTVEPTPTPTPAPYIVAADRPSPTATRVVPTATPVPTKIRVHIVAAFDTLTGIANLYGTTVRAIKNRNGLTGETIYRGQRLIIP